MFNIVLALRLWGKFWSNASVCIRCDNLAVVQVVLNLKTKDNILAAFVHNVWFICAMWNLDLKINHIRGTLNVEVDLLSRLYSDKSVGQTLLAFLHENCIRDKVEASHLQSDLSL